MKDFQPVIVAFLCHWCSYDGADAAGRARKIIPPGLRIVRLMCSGRVSAGFVLEAFAHGADGVLVLGCPEGECHYRNGNREVLKRIRLLSRILPALGIECGRLRLDWVSAGQSDRFAAIAEDMAAEIKKTGPLRRHGE